MFNNISILDMGPEYEKELDQLMRVLVLEADSLVKEGTPVDTGRLAASWQIGQNDTSGVPKKPGKYQNAGPARGSNYQVGKEKVGNTYYVHNNLPYAEPVVFGTSLPPSWGGKYRSEIKKEAKPLNKKLVGLT